MTSVKTSSAVDVGSIVTVTGTPGISMSQHPVVLGQHCVPPAEQVQGVQGPDQDLASIRKYSPHWRRSDTWWCKLPKLLLIGPPTPSTSRAGHQKWETLRTSTTCLSNHTIIPPSSQQTVMVQNGHGHTITSLAIPYYTGLDNVWKSRARQRAMTSLLGNQTDRMVGIGLLEWFPNHWNGSFDTHIWTQEPDQF